ncbi:DUF1173 domain-containing protein [Roseateles saccharophilus]|uniref:Uncharacterized protein DUF1173 n=1 Tax=Roseateles saccharophilus TaxID=304 RepID=A0A4R3UJB9_ROSSA|nr:DUF1173 domain-containing protein [Roseateles saccharophilus]MDG0834866.1 DUF1173 domain-containing protein [Roseateles saccharophilus]TCU88400.1 uncharacterized protein DUF1173 [Roseateles saccharophilus]
MAPTVHRIAAAASVYEVDGRQLAIDAPDFADIVADAHAAHLRLRCLCQPDGVEMYVARLARPDAGFVVKRMPDTGWQHAPECPSYAPPAALSGLGQVLGTAITEDPETGETTLRLGFAMDRLPDRTGIAASGAFRSSVCADGIRLSLRGLLHYLWDQAGLTRWHPDLAGRRTWPIVRGLLLQAAQSMIAKRTSLRTRLFIPEPFFVEQRDAIDARRRAAWSQALSRPTGRMPMMLLLAEVKEVAPARYGFKATIKHMPDLAFAIEAALFRRLERCFESELTLWAASDDIHMVLIATFGVGNSGVPSIQELCLMPVSRQWLPVDDGFGKQLVDRLVAEERAFTRSLRYDLGAQESLAFAVLSDSGARPTTLRVLHGDPQEPTAWPETESSDDSTWIWHTHLEPLPPLPSHEQQGLWGPVIAASKDAARRAADQSAETTGRAVLGRHRTRSGSTRQDAGFPDRGGKSAPGIVIARGGEDL